MHCTNCGNKNDPDTKFCGKCGAEHIVKDTDSKINFVSNSTWATQTTGVKIAIYIVLAFAGLILVSMILLYIPSFWR